MREEREERRREREEKREEKRKETEEKRKEKRKRREKKKQQTRALSRGGGGGGGTLRSVWSAWLRSCTLLLFCRCACLPDFFPSLAGALFEPSPSMSAKKLFLNLHSRNSPFEFYRRKIHSSPPFRPFRPAHSDSVLSFPKQLITIQITIQNVIFRIVATSTRKFQGIAPHRPALRALPC